MREHHASDLAASFQRLVHRHLVGVLEVAADRHAHGDARHPHAERLQQPREVDGRRLAFDVRVGRQDHFGRRRSPTRASSPLIFRSSGPMPCSGDSAPIST